MIKKVLSIILISILTIFLVTTFTLYIFNIKPHAVIGDSMHPTIKKGALAYIKYIDDEGRENLEVEDIVLIEATTPYVHRIINILDDQVETKGDNSNTDGFMNKNKILGIYIFHIPLIGYLFIKQIQIILLVLIIFSISLYLFIKIYKKEEVK